MAKKNRDETSSALVRSGLMAEDEVIALRDGYARVSLDDGARSEVGESENEYQIEEQILADFVRENENEHRDSTESQPEDTQQPQHKKKSVRWADAMGRDLAVVCLVESADQYDRRPAYPTNDDGTVQMIFVLLFLLLLVLLVSALSFLL
jgi:hypothetical protein